jgi:simple sugar transport system permease protein
MGLFRQFSFRLISVLLALGITILIIYATGVDPLFALSSLFQGSFGSIQGISETIVLMTPLLLSALGVIIAFRAKLINIGSEGQMAMGIVGAGIVSVGAEDITGLLLLALIGGFIFGGLWGGLAGFLKAKLNLSEIVSTLMLNFIALLFITYLAQGPWRDPSSVAAVSYPIPLTAQLLRFVSGTRLHIGIIVVVVCIIGVYFLLWKTTWGYRMRAVGINIEAARAGGIRVGSTIVLTMFISGGLAGLAGAVQLSGVYHRVLPAMTANIGYNSILVALLGNLSIIGSILASILFSSLIVGADTMYYLTGISRYLVFFIQGLIILFVISGDKLISDEKFGSIRQKIFSKVK